jgi:RNA polymerase sigma-70 factor (sigma-E family)
MKSSNRIRGTADGTGKPRKAFLSETMMTIEVGTVERVAGGRLAELYAGHAHDATRLAYLLTGDRALAEDLVQDAFVRLAGRFLDLRDPDGFAHYLRRTVVNLSNSWYRRRRVERAYVERAGAAPQHPVSGPDPAERDALWRKLQRLSQKQRAAIVLRFYEDLSEEQTAEAMGVPKGTVKSLVSRGLEAMRRQMEGE